MYCSRCGTQNDDNAKYCIQCGAELKPQGNAPGLNGVHTGGAAPNYPFSEGSVTRALRGLILSPLFLVAVIAQTAQVVLSIVSSASGTSTYVALINRLMYEADIPTSVYSYQLQNAMSGAGALSAIISNAPAVMIAVGLWLQFVYARNASQKMPTTGFTMIRVITIIEMVGLCLGLGLTVIGCIVALAAAGRYGSSHAGGPVIVTVVIVILAIAGIGALMVLYFLKILKMLSSAISIIDNGIQTEQASMFVIVLTFIGGGLTALSALGSLALSPFAFLAMAASATSSIAFGLLMLNFNKLGPGAIYTPPVQRDVIYTPPENIPPPPVQVHKENIPVPPAPDNTPNFNIPPKPGTVVIGWDGQDQKMQKYANEGTMVLNENMYMPPAKLVHAGDYRETRISKPEFVIGKAYGSVDFFIENNPAVSRKHARIVLKDGKYYIVDTKSTNHVYVDGQMIPVETPVLLKDGMMIRLADEVFTFRETE